MSPYIYEDQEKIIRYQPEHAHKIRYYFIISYL